jgi:hypothetical protein
MEQSGVARTSLVKYAMELKWLAKELSREHCPISIVKNSWEEEEATCPTIALPEEVLRQAIIQGTDTDEVTKDEDRAYMWFLMKNAARPNDADDAWIGRVEDQEVNAFLVNNGKTKGNQEGRVLINHQVEVVCVPSIPTFFLKYLEMGFLPKIDDAREKRIVRLINSLGQPPGNHTPSERYTLRSFKKGGSHMYLGIISKVNKGKLQTPGGPFSDSTWSNILKHVLPVETVSRTTTKHYAERTDRPRMLDLANSWRSGELTALSLQGIV